MTTTAIIVTFNRQNDLIRCIDNVLKQTVIPNNLVIVNNASTDDTLQNLNQYFNKSSSQNYPHDTLTPFYQHNTSQIYIINKATNTGGSGGFYTGLKTAFEELQTDFYWMMDDDGYPEQQCLEQLLSLTDKYDYIMPTSIDINDHSKLSWPTRMTNGKKTEFYQDLKNSWGYIMNYVTPFNGILLSKKCVATVGYINKDFFIWGDEYDHYYRCKQKGIYPITLLPAKFYHPALKLPLVKICFGLFTIPFVDNPLRMVCLARNYTYIYRHYNKKYKIPIKYLMYFWLFIFTRHGDFNGWMLYKQSVKDGFTENFTRHLKFLE